VNNLALKQDPAPLRLEYGLVLGGNERLYTVRTILGEAISEQAVSCLVQPRAGDTVLLSQDNAGNCFILSVLKRSAHQAGQTDLVLDGEVNLHVKDGGLSLTSDKDLRMVSREAITCTSSTISVHADEGKARIMRFSFLGDLLKTQVRRMKTVALTMDNICRRLTQKLGNSLCFIREHEEVQSGSSRHLVEETMSLHAKNVMQTAEEHVTVNAEQIHLG